MLQKMFSGIANFCMHLLQNPPRHKGNEGDRILTAAARKLRSVLPMLEENDTILVPQLGSRAFKHDFHFHFDVFGRPAATDALGA